MTLFTARPIIFPVRRIAIAATLVFVAAGIAVAATRPGFAAAVTGAEITIQHRIGTELALAGVYLEETGVPMPVPSEVSIGYLGQRMGENPLTLFATWLGITALIVLGSTNLFAASRRFGPRLISGRIGTALHLTPTGIARARRWFTRWGPLAIAISRFVPGMRWAMAVTCGTLGVSDRTFWLSTAISASIWAGILLTVGVTAGDAIGHVIATHLWIGLLLPLPAAAVITTGLVRIALQQRAAVSPSAAPPPLSVILTRRRDFPQ